MNMLSLALRFIAIVGAIAAIALFFTVKGQLAQERGKVETLTTQKGGVEQQLSTVNQQLASSQSQVNALNSDLTSRNERISELTKQIRELNSSNTRVTEQFEANAKELESTKRQLSDTRRELVETRVKVPDVIIQPEQLRELEKQVADLKKQVADLEATNVLLRNRVPAEAEVAATGQVSESGPRARREAPANLTGQVLSVGGNGSIVAVSFGANQGASEGTRIRLIKGSTLLGELTLTNVQNDFSVGQVRAGVGSPGKISKGEEVLIIVQ